MPSKFFNDIKSRVRSTPAQGGVKEQASPTLPPLVIGPDGRWNRKPRIFVGIPCHDNRVNVMYAMSMWDLVNANKYDMAFTKTSSGGITKARNDLAWRALKGSWDYILLTDTDLGFTHAHLDQMLARDVDIIGAMYPHKTVDLAWSAHHLPGGAISHDGLQEVAGIGFGLVLIKVQNVFGKMMAEWPNLIKNAKETAIKEIMVDVASGKITAQDAVTVAFDKGFSRTDLQALNFKETWSDGRNEWKYGFFQERILLDPDAGHNVGTWMTEDWFFTYNCRKLGIKIYTDNNFYLKHYDGNQCFPNDKIMATMDTLHDCAQNVAGHQVKAQTALANIWPGWVNGMRPKEEVVAEAAASRMAAEKAKS